MRSSFDDSWQFLMISNSGYHDCYRVWVTHISSIPQEIMQVVCLMFWRSDISANKPRKYKKTHQQSIIHKLFWEFCLWIDIIFLAERICHEAFQHMRGTIGMHVLTVGRVTGSPEQTMSETISCWYMSWGSRTSSLAIHDNIPSFCNSICWMRILIETHNE